MRRLLYLTTSPAVAAVLLPVVAAILLLLAATACKKSSNTDNFASASFYRTINGGSPWSWDFSNKTGGMVNFTQTYYTGSVTPF